MLSIVNWLDPGSWAQWLNDQIQGSVMTLVEWVQHLLMNPPNLMSSGPAIYLFGNAVGLAPTLAYVAVYTGALLAMFQQKRIKNLVQLVAAAIFVTIGATFWFWASAILYDWGTQLAQALHWYHPTTGTGSGMITLNPLSNVGMSIVGFAGIGIAALLLWAILLMYTGLNVAINFWFLPALTLYGLGDGWKKFVKLIVSLMLVTMLFGRGGAVFVIDTFRWLAGGVNTGVVELNTAMTYGFTTCGLFAAVGVQCLLLWLTYKGISFIEGKYLDGRSEVTGKVQTETDEALRANIQQANIQHAQSMVPPQTQGYEHRMTIRERGQLAAQEQIIHRGSKVVTAGLMAGLTYVGAPPQVKAAAVAVAGKGRDEVLYRARHRAERRSLAKTG
jgi:hypothetical protein